MKKITVKNKCIGSGIKHIGWSGRGWIDGGPTGAGPMNSQAPSWDSYGQEIGINMVRTGFSIRHFLSETANDKTSLSEQIKKGLENREVSWAKSEQTSYSYLLQRCYELGWKVLICINPSYGSAWSPSFLTQSSHHLRIWRDFCFYLVKSIEEHWPQVAQYFEITNEPDLGYFDGESLLPGYQGPRGGITPLQYSLLLQNAYQGIKRAVPHAKIIGPALASWNQSWLEKVLTQIDTCLDGVSYHNVGGNLEDEETLREAKRLLSQYAPHIADCVINSEWAWWPNHDINQQHTALRIAHILYTQTVGNALGSFYLGPAQPKDFKKGLGVLHFHPDNPNSVERTKSFFAFRLMARAILGEKKLELINPLKKLKILAVINNRKEIVITVINPSKKKFRNISIDIDQTIPLLKEPFLTFRQFDDDHSDSCEKSDYNLLKGFNVKPESILQFVFSISP